jgi:hypothetical protein
VAGACNVADFFQIPRPCCSHNVEALPCTRDAFATLHDEVQNDVMHDASWKVRM